MNQKTNRIPPSWSIAKLSDVIISVSANNKKLKQKEYQESGKFPVIDQGHEFIGGYSDDESLVLDFEPPVVVFGDHTKVKKYVNFRFIVGADGVKVLKPFSCFVPKLFYYFLHCIKFVDKGYARHYQYLVKELIPIPPIPEQHRIVSKLEALFSQLDTAVATLKKAKEQIKTYKQSVLFNAVTGELTKEFRQTNDYSNSSGVLFNKISEQKEKGKLTRITKKSNFEEDNLPIIPTEWNYYRLEDLCFQISDGTHFTPKYQKNGIKFLSVKNVRPFKIKDESVKYISEEEYHKINKRCNPENGDILYTKVGATFGFACIINLDYPFSIFVSLALLKPVKEFFLSKFLEILMNSELVFNQARKRVSGIGVPDLHLIEIRDFQVPLPPIDEQHAIINEIETRFSEAENLEKAIDLSLKQAESLRQSILKKAFDGRLVPQDPNDEPAEKLLERIKKEKKK